LLLWFGEYLPEVQGGGDGGDCMPHRTDKNRKVHKVRIIMIRLYMIIRRDIETFAIRVEQSEGSEGCL
jgi:hypothetical protein